MLKSNGFVSATPGDSAMLKVKFTDYEKQSTSFYTLKAGGQLHDGTHYTEILFGNILDSILNYITSLPGSKITASAFTLLSVTLVTVLGPIGKLAINIDLVLQYLRLISGSRKVYIVGMLTGNSQVFSVPVPVNPVPEAGGDFAGAQFKLYNKQKPQSHFRAILYTFYLLIAATGLLFFYKGCRA